MDLDFSAEIILENERSRLEPLQLRHVDLLQEVGAEDDGLMKYSPSAVHTREMLTAYIQNALDEKGQHFKFPFAIYDKLKNAYAGSSSFGAISNKDRRLEIGWTWIGKDFQRTGLNRNNKFLMLSYTFETLGFERVELKTDARNEQSRTAILAIGAKFEGELRSHSVMSDGFRRNTVYYSILKEEWPEVKGRISPKA